MKHGIEHLSTPLANKGWAGLMSQLKGQILSALNDLEFWCFVSIGLLMLMHS